LNASCHGLEYFWRKELISILVLPETYNFLPLMLLYYGEKVNLVILGIRKQGIKVILIKRL
jgi:hypothetical protein